MIAHTVTDNKIGSLKVHIQFSKFPKKKNNFGVIKSIFLIKANKVDHLATL